MAMHMSETDESDGLLSTINTTPLVDVMLVLLIIFLITIPAVTASINVDLPRENIQRHEVKPQSLSLTIDAKGLTYMDGKNIAHAELIQNLKSLAINQPQIDIEIIGDAQAEFHSVGQVLALIKNAGLTKVSFLTEPLGETVK